MKPSGYRLTAWVCGASCAFNLVATDVSAGTRESQRIKPIFENSSIEQPEFEGTTRVRPRITRLRTEQPKREELLPLRAALIRPSFERPAFAGSDTIDLFHRPQRRPLGGFPKGPRIAPPRHFVPGHGNNLKAYRLGTRARVREHCAPHDRFYFRDQKLRKPDDER